MNWDAISAIAELLGAVGVILSLLYVATQVRHSRHSTNSATYQTIQTNLATTARLLSDNGELAKMYDAAILGESLDEADSTRLKHLFDGLTYQYEDLFFLHEQGSLETDLFMNQIENGREIFVNKYYLEALAARKGELSSRFRKFILAIVREDV